MLTWPITLPAPSITAAGFWGATMKTDHSPAFASPAALLTRLQEASRSPADLAYRVGTESVPGRWFLPSESDLEQEIVLDPRRWDGGGDPVPALWAAAEAEWAAGAPMPEVLLRAAWKGLSGSGTADPP